MEDKSFSKVVSIAHLQSTIKYQGVLLGVVDHWVPGEEAYALERGWRRLGGLKGGSGGFHPKTAIHQGL